MPPTVATALVCALLSVSALRAQPFTITDTCLGNTARFALTSIPTTPTSPTAGAEFNANPCDPAAINLFAAWPLYQVEDDGAGGSDARATTFNSAGGQLAGPVIAGSGDSMQMQWLDVDGRGLFGASYTIAIECCGVRCARTTHTITLTNLTTNPIRVSLYAFADIDLNDSFGDDRTSPDSTAERHVILDDSGCGGSFEFWGDSIANFEIDSFPRIESRLLASGGPLTNGGLPFGPSDYTGAFQWTPTIPAAGNWSGTFTLGHNCLRCAASGSAQNYGTGLGAGGAVPTIGTQAIPVPGCEVEVDLQGPPNTFATVLIGFTQTVLPFPGCPETFLLLPVVTQTTPTNASGAGTFVIPGIPDPDLCGLTVYLQGWFPVASSPGCFPIAHSNGLRLTYGSI